MKCEHESSRLEPIMKTFQYSSDEIILEVEDICNECDKKLGQETQIFNLRE